MALTMGKSDNGYLTIIMLFMSLPLFAFASIDKLRRYFTILASYVSVIKIIQLIETVMGDRVSKIEGLYT